MVLDIMQPQEPGPNNGAPAPVTPEPTAPVGAAPVIDAGRKNGFLGGLGRVIGLEVTKPPVAGQAQSPEVTTPAASIDPLNPKTVDGTVLKPVISADGNPDLSKSANLATATSPIVTAEPSQPPVFEVHQDGSTEQRPDVTPPTMPEPPVVPQATGAEAPKQPDAPLVNNPPEVPKLELVHSGEKRSNYIATLVYKMNPGKYVTHEGNVLRLDRITLEEDMREFLTDPKNVDALEKENPGFKQDLIDAGIDLAAV